MRKSIADMSRTMCSYVCMNKKVDECVCNLIAFARWEENLVEIKFGTIFSFFEFDHDEHEIIAIV